VVVGIPVVAGIPMVVMRRRRRCSIGEGGATRGFSGWPKEIRLNVSATTAAFPGNAVFGLQ